MPRDPDAHPRFLRLLQIVRALSARRFGMTATELRRLAGVSRASIYRDIAAIESCGFPLERREGNGEVRLVLSANDTRLAENAPPLDARLAYEILRGLYFAPLAGLEPVDALDAHFRRLSLKLPVSGPSAVSEPAAAVLEMRRDLGTAIADRRRVRLTLRDPRTRATSSEDVDPKGWRLVRGQPYLLVLSPATGTARLVKGLRIRGVELLEELQADTEQDARLLATAADASYDAPFEGVVVFPARFAELVGEYPLNAQQSHSVRPDGKVEVRVVSTNLWGAVRWVLGWGGDAEALAPPALRDHVAAEARAMAAAYSD